MLICALNAKLVPLYFKMTIVGNVTIVKMWLKMPKSNLWKLKFQMVRKELGVPIFYFDIALPFFYCKFCYRPFLKDVINREGGGFIKNRGI